MGLNRNKPYHHVNTIITLMSVIIVLFNVIFFVKDSFFYNLNDLPEGEFLYSSMSPNGAYVIKSYYYPGTDSLSNGIRCELVDLSDETSRNIYWQTGTDTSFTSWSANTIININGVMIDVTSDYTYDWRKTTS